jgi:peroxiredoxin
MGVVFEPTTTRALQIMANSPAQAAGIRVGDEVLAIDGEPVTKPPQIIKRIASTPAGTTLTLTVRRDGAELAVPVKVAARPSEDEMLAALLGKPAPTFTASLVAGGQQALAELRGQVVLVEFWATWCGPCTMQFPDLNRLHKQYAAKGVHILALTGEDRGFVTEYVAAEHLDYPIALDPDDAIRRQYVAFALPTTIVVDKAGVVRYLHAGVTDPAELEAVIVRLLK